MAQKHVKNFDAWNEIKKETDATVRQVFAHEREVWWCSLGINIGAEIDGKHDGFERPVIIMRVYNKDTMLVLPATSRAKLDKFHTSLKIQSKDKNTKAATTKTVYVKLTQARVISSKRLIRKVSVVNKEDFSNIQNEFRKFT